MNGASTREKALTEYVKLLIQIGVIEQIDDFNYKIKGDLTAEQLKADSVGADK